MKIRRLCALLTAGLWLAGCAAPTASVPPSATQAPTAAATAVSAATAAQPPAATATAATASPTAEAGLPYAHTACAAGVNLTGQTINLYHFLYTDAHVDPLVDPLNAGYTDATAYFNAHGGICGASIGQVFPDTSRNYDGQAIYDNLLAQPHPPVLVALYYYGDSEILGDQLARDQIPALGVRSGSPTALYTGDRHTLGWIFGTEPLYADQIGSMCDYIAAHAERYPHPVMGFMAWDGTPGLLVTPQVARDYCAKLGIGYAGGETTDSADVATVQPTVEKLIQAGANIIYTNANEGVPLAIAKSLLQLGVQPTVTVAAYNWGLDPNEALLDQLHLGADGLPLINGMIGSHVTRSLAEVDQPGIQLINAQADAAKRALPLRGDGYVKAWSMTDLFREVYVQTGNRVGYDHVTGAEIKATLEKLSYATLGGVERIDYQGGTRRSLAVNRIGQLGFLGADGKTPAGPGNPVKNVAVISGTKLFAPLVVPLTDDQPAPDLRPGGADAPAITDTSAALAGLTGRIAFVSGADVYSGNANELYVINADGSGLKRLTDNAFYDDSPAWSPDGSKVAFIEEQSDGTQVFIMNPDGTGQTNLTNSAVANAGNDSWSPDGKQILFAAGPEGQDDIYIMNADGSHLLQLTNTPQQEDWPRMSPDGKQIVYISNKGKGAVYVMNTDGSGQTQLYDGPIHLGLPAWSPDGQHIAFDTYRDGNDEVYVMNADGSGLTRLTNNPAVDYSATWSPDGLHIAFQSDRDGTTEIYVMNPDGSGQTRLTDSPEGAGAADWTR